MSLSITIVDWEKFNPRTDRKSSWLRLDNEFFEKTRKWTADQQRVFLYLCTRRSKNEDKPTFQLDIEAAEFHLSLKEKQILTAIQALNHYGCVVVTDPTPPGNQMVALRTNVTDVTNGVTAPERNHFKIETEDDLVSGLPLNTKERWQKLYPDPAFIKREVTKAWGYYSDDPKKKPESIRGWCQALSSWLERSWKQRVPNIPPRQSSAVMRVVPD